MIFNLKFLLTNLSYEMQNRLIEYAQCYSAIGSASVQAGTFDGCVGLPCRRVGMNSVEVERVKGQGKLRSQMRYNGHNV